MLHFAYAESCEVITTYLDRNKDGKVDREFHDYPCLEDANWELLDENYDQRYDKKILYSIGPIESEVDFPINNELITND